MIAEKSIIKRLGNQLFFTGPTMVLFTVAVLVPFAYGFYLTLMKMTSPVSPLEFSGIANYRSAFNDPQFWDSMWLTVKYVGATIVFVNVIGFALAYLVTSGIRSQNFFRTALFTPNLIGGLVLGYIWQFIFVQSLPMIGEKLGIEVLRLGWLGDELLAFWALVIVTIWQSAGYMMIIFIAGLISVPRDIIEASTIDGANGWQRLVKMTLPLMIPSFVVTVFLTLKNAFMVYDINFALTEGGPYNSTMMVSMHVVQKAFLEVNYGVGQAEAIILFVIVAVVTGLQVYFSKRMEVQA
ncbi:ABC transporter permease [Paenibacillus darwinianus]|uniref:ABC transporter permease n=1 Tax=Paenibacillus darwinianus TaxID=1380763 RepID=A0A9W5S1M3_9BACL|nr:sugar ABC transporter permease [Paenibacillus darwinianus]EXX90398.1 ABC transporter permease [Paenibacillus darwinianus]EXX91082.1 ABC transporter permease [Paenibacillus darwinianus]EXX91976.1 ABC transporter permease [Paenibacillus darwinianus]